MAGPYFPGYVTKGDFSRITSSAEHELGTIGFSGGRILEYVKHGAGTARYNWVGLDITETTYPANTVKILQPDGTHQPMGVAEYGGTINNYGWITRFGPATAKVDATVALGVGVINASAATGSSKTFTGGSATLLYAGLKGIGVIAKVPNATGHAYVKVTCL